MTGRVRLDLGLLLPEVRDARDACVSRVENVLLGKPGITQAHVMNADVADAAVLCLHYDPAVVSLSEVERAAHAAGAQVTERYGHALLPLRLIGGEDIGRRMEELISAEPGVLFALVNPAAQTARVEFDRGRTSEQALREALDRLVHAAPERVGERPPTVPGPPRVPWIRRNRELAISLAAGVLLATAWAGTRWLDLWPGAAIGLYLGSYALGAYDLLRHLAASLRKGKVTPDIELLMLLAAAGAAVLGEWAEGAFLLFLFSLAHALEHYALDRARGAIRALADLSPRTARVRRGTIVEVPVEDIRTGEVVAVRPGERIPVDGAVQSGHSAVNQAPLTGESVPVEKAPSDEVFAGSVNGEGALFVTATRVVGDRTLDRVVQLVEEAQTQKAPTQQFTDRFEGVFVPAVLIGVLVIASLAPLLGFWSWEESFRRGMAILVAASPCALALGTPSAVLAGIAQAARNGVLIKGGAHLENLATVNAVALDKTGTLTVGEPRVTDLDPLLPADERELLSLAAAVERDSQHPLARAVLRAAEEKAVPVPEATRVQSVTGRGVRGTVGADTIEVGSTRMWENGDAPPPAAVTQRIAELQRAGRTTMVVRAGVRWLGVLGLADSLRPGTREILERLRKMGMTRVTMLTGDNEGIGRAVAVHAGIDSVAANLLPEDKIAAIREMERSGGRVAMVGDGVNDAPALAQATVGIAMGGAGAAVALETADVALMADDLSKLPFAIGLARRTGSIIRQNLYLSLGVIGLLMVAAFGGLAGIGTAVVVHEGSTLLVIANALRLLGFREGA